MWRDQERSSRAQEDRAAVDASRAEPGAVEHWLVDSVYEEAIAARALAVKSLSFGRPPPRVLTLLRLTVHSLIRSGSRARAVWEGR